MELTAAVSRTIEEAMIELPPGPATVCRNDGPRSEQAAKSPARVPCAQTAVPAASDVSVAMLTPANEAPCYNQFRDSSSTTTLAVDVAKDTQARALDTMTAVMHAALDLTKDLASPDSDLQEGPAAEYHAVMLELVKVHAGATLQHTRQLGRARTLSELIELSSTQVRKQCELALQQTELLKSLIRNAGNGRR
jgi:hypothetical protein